MEWGWAVDGNCFKCPSLSGTMCLWKSKRGARFTTEVKDEAQDLHGKQRSLSVKNDFLNVTV